MYILNNMAAVRHCDYYHFFTYEIQYFSIGCNFVFWRI